MVWWVIPCGWGLVSAPALMKLAGHVMITKVEGWGNRKDMPFWEV
jgi:hypothetical protein